MEETEEFLKGVLGARPPRYFKEGFQLVLGLLQFLGAEGQGLLHLPLFRDIALHTDDQLHVAAAVDERGGQNPEHSFLSLAVEVNLVALCRTLDRRRFPDGAMDSVLP